MVIGNNKLTAKMEHFAQLLFQGYSQTDAYKLAYPRTGQTEARYALSQRLTSRC